MADISRDERPINVAIACQGGGAQTAFTAGALSWLLRRYREDDPRQKYRIVALSGTSGGAVCASMAWRDILLHETGTGAAPTVERFWKTAYPDGNAAMPWPGNLAEDWRDLLAEGRLPGQNIAARARGDLATLWREMLEPLWRMAPVRAEFELQPYHWKRGFDAIDSSPAGLAGKAMAGAFRSQLHAVRALPLPGAAQVATFWGEMFDLLSPFHDESVVHPATPPLARRDFDVQDAFRAVLERYFDADCLARLQAEIARRAARGDLVPEVLVGATDAMRVRDVRERPDGAGDSQDPAVRRARDKAIALEDHAHHRADQSSERILRGTVHLARIVDCILASAAIPTLMRGIDFEGTTLWDGLYATNPPVYNLPDVHSSRPGAEAEAQRNRAENDPEEIWVIRINPTQTERPLDTAAAIADRRNELSGNLPLNQEIRNVIQMGGATKGNRSYRPITFGFIDMSEAIAADLDLPSKSDTRLEQIERLFDDGTRQMERFFARWQAVTG